MSWSGARVIAMCDSGWRYQVGVFVSNAAPGDDEVRAWVEKDATPVIVELTGFPSALPSGWEPASGVDGVLSVGRLKPIERGKCP